MSNSSFQFKQFRIAQEHCAMKVTTDACIQGAWTPVLPGTKRVLDIGAGTALLSFMLAQRSPEILIDAIEADPKAAEQACQNVADSPWIDRINLINADARKHVFQHKYELIISNPPFFTNSLLSPDPQKNAARHTLSLTYQDLLKTIEANLADNGYVSILLPYTEYLQWRAIMREKEWNESGKLNIIHKPNAPIKRVISLWSKKENQSLKEETLTIKDNDNNYTTGFIVLLSPFYLYL